MQRTSIFRILTVVLILGCITAISSCKKTDDKSAEPNKPAVANDIQPVEDGGKSQPGETNKVEPQPAGDMVPLKLELPKPMFVGTPPSMKGVANLQKARQGARPAFYVPKGTAKVSLG